MDKEQLTFQFKVSWSLQDKQFMHTYKYRQLGCYGLEN